MKKELVTLIFANCLAVSAGSFAYAAEEEKAYNDSAMTQSFNGTKEALANMGIAATLDYKADFMSNVAGGVKRRGEFLDNTDLKVTFDGEKLYNVKGSKIFLYAINNNGGRPNDAAGTVQGVDNIEVSARTAKLYEAWIEQNFMDDQFSLRTGLYDLNSEFYVTDSSGLFINSTFGIGTEIAQTGVNGPSIFPTTSFGGRFKWQPDEKTYVQVAVLDGVAGDPHNPQGTHVQFNDRDGVLGIAEASHTFDFARFAVGAWEYSERSDDLTEVDASGNPVKSRNNGFYVMSEKEICPKTTAFVRFGMADQDLNQTDYSWATGVTVDKIVPGRDNSQLGFAVTGAHNSDKYMTSQSAGGTPADNMETGFELTYSDNLLPWLRIQPDIQYTINPGTNPDLDDSWMIGVRFEVAAW